MTTNDLLTRVLTDLDQLIQWADADVEGSVETDARGQAAMDRRRATVLRRARRELDECFR